MTLISKLKNKIKYLLQKSPVEVSKEVFIKGYKEYQKTGHTPDEAYHAMIALFCSSNGKFNAEFHQRIRNTHPSQTPVGSIKGVLGELDATAFGQLDKELNRDGYVIFNNKLSPEICTRIYNAALEFPTVVKGFEEKLRYDPANPVSEIYRIRSTDMMNNADIQALIADPTLINIARNYFGCEPIFDFPAMWWSTSFSKKASDDAAQLYHFDMDRIKWLKIFFYINDVTEENGPHSYIRGTHLPGTKPPEILARGYVRVPDEELREHYPAADFKVVYGQAGAMFAGDTMCWHKGTPLVSGHRLVLELEYTTSLFGVNHPKLQVSNSSTAFKEFCKNHPVYSANIDFEN